MYMYMHVICVSYVCFQDEPCTSSGKRSHDNDESPDIEDIGAGPAKRLPTRPVATVTKHPVTPSQQLLLGKKESWKDVLGPPPDRGTTRVRCEVM